MSLLFPRSVERVLNGSVFFFFVGLSPLNVNGFTLQGNEKNISQTVTGKAGTSSTQVGGGWDWMTVIVSRRKFSQAAMGQLFS